MSILFQDQWLRNLNFDDIIPTDFENPTAFYLAEKYWQSYSLRVTSSKYKWHAQLTAAL